MDIKSCCCRLHYFTSGASLLFIRVALVAGVSVLQSPGKWGWPIGHGTPFRPLIYYHYPMTFDELQHKSAIIERRLTRNQSTPLPPPPPPNKSVTPLQII